MASRRQPSPPVTPESKTSRAEEQRLSRASEALRETRRRIIDLRFPPGYAFTEGELADDLGLSKTPVREALLVLASEGLVFARPGAGYRVSPVTLRDAKSLCAYRALLESESAALAARRGLDSHATMHVTEILEGKVPRRKASVFEDNTLFHLYLASAAQDKYLYRDLSRVLQELERLVRLALPSSTADEVHHGHRELLDAVLSGDEVAARSAAFDHAERTEKLVVEALLSSEVLQGINLGQPAAVREADSRGT